MKSILTFITLFLLISCKDNDGTEKTSNNACDIAAIQASNSSKVTINNGVWGTVWIRQGNCMPVTDLKTTSCSECAIQREVRVYAYTTTQNAVPILTIPSLYASFNTQLIKTISSDASGFFQTDLPDGKYTIVFVEDSKLYASYYDSQGGISPIIIQGGKLKQNLVLNRAVY